jgi:hypothetical protein
MRFSTLSIAVASLVASLASANALPQPQFRAGILECEGGQNVGFVVGSMTSLECVFQSEGHRPEPYIATVRRFGLDLGGPQNSYALQPISVQGQTGFNVAAGVADIELAPVRFGPRRHYRHRHHG